jgi:hypothetical protein
MSRHVVFLEHVPFCSFPSTIHSLTKTDLIRIDYFSEDSDSLSSYVSSTLDISLHVRPICTHQSTGTNTLLSDIPEALFSSTAPQASSKIVDLPLC